MKKCIVSLLIVLFTLSFSSVSFARGYSYSYHSYSHTSSYSPITHTHYHTSTLFLKPIHHKTRKVITYKHTHIGKKLSSKYHYKQIKPFYPLHEIKQHRYKL